MITMHTPYPDMYKEFWENFDKCAYWVNKQTQRNSYINDVHDKLLKGEIPLQQTFDKIEWKSPKGNRWINTLSVSLITGEHIAFRLDSICYWETLGSVGAFLPFRYNGEKFIFILSGHFFQRLCERSGYKMQGIHTISKFLDDHKASEMEVVPARDGGKRNEAYIHFNGGMACGVEVSKEYNIYEIRTWFDEKELTGWKKQRHDNAEVVSEEDKMRYEHLKCLLATMGMQDQVNSVFNNIKEFFED